MRRVVVVGGPGSGKSTVASTLAERIGAQHVELDELWWGPGWMPAGRLELRQRLSERLAVDTWVVDGNYIDEIADLVWSAADAVVWLDPPRHVAIRRAVLRSAGRAVRRTELWNGNRESLAVLSPNSILRLRQRWPGYSERIAYALAQYDVADTKAVRLDSDAAVARWLTSP